MKNFYTMLCRAGVFIFFFCLSLQGFSQEFLLKGTVTNNAQEPLVGVNVMIKQRFRGTVTQPDGTYEIQAQKGDTLLFTYLGYQSVKKIIAQENTINVQLQAEENTLDATIINAGYYNTTERERTGSIEKVTSEEIEQQPVTNPLAALQGRMAGVNITQNTGVPGGAFDIQIRGRNSIRAGGNQPLYVVDGVPYGANSIGDQNIANILPAANVSPLNSIGLSNIESIEVLKDADATAIYGSRGANGVVLITTKKGKAGKTTVHLKSYTGVGHITHKADLLSTPKYLEMRREAFANDGITDIPENAYDINGEWDPNRYTDWQEELIGGSSEMTHVEASVSGGSEQTRFLISAAYDHQTTVFPGDFKYNKGSVHTNINHHSKDEKFRINLSANYTANKNDQPWMDLSRTAYTLSPNAPALYDEDGQLNWEDGTFTNPLAILKGKYKSQTQNLIANSVLSYRFIPSLQVKVNLGYTDLHHFETRTSPHTLYDPAYGLDSSFSSLFTNQRSRDSWIVEPQINWSKNFGNLGLEALVGSTFQQQTDRILVQEADDFASNSLIYDLASASFLYVFSNDETVYNYQAIFGRFNINWDKKYILNLTGRRDGSSRFGPGNQFANFGAVGAAWLFSEENFLKNSDWLNLGKLRASYGSTGNDQIGDYQYLDTYQSSGSSYGGTIGLAPSRLFNPNFGWEVNKKLEAALELGMFKDRIFLTAAWYKNRSSNQLVGIPLPGTTGFSSLQANLGATVENTGFEFDLNTKNLKGDGLQWTTSFNFTIPKNKLVSFPNLDASTYVNQYVVGEPLDIQKVYQYNGIDTKEGVYTFEDVNNDGTISTPDDNQLIQILTPEIYGGITNNFSYKNWNLNFLFQFKKQKQPDFHSLFGLPGTMSNQPTTVLDRWQQVGDLTEYQQFSTGMNPEIYRTFSLKRMSNANFTDASFVRLKNISLTYTIPRKWIKAFETQLFFQGQNLLTFTKYKGPDPEFSLGGYLPPLRVITAGIQINY